MRGWIRVGLVLTALWVVALAVAVVYQGEAPVWRELKVKSFAQWHRETVESETGRSLADWDLQVRVARESCLAHQARKPSVGEVDACQISPLYAKPSTVEWIGIYVDAIVQYVTDWLHVFLFPIAVWSFFVPFCIWFIGIAAALLMLRLRGDRPRQTPAQRKRIIH